MVSEISPLIESLTLIEEDETLPKNVKLKIRNAMEALQSEGDIKMRANKALQALDDISDDQNVPSYVRPQIWNVVSLLEGF